MERGDDQLIRLRQGDDDSDTDEIDPDAFLPDEEPDETEKDMLKQSFLPVPTAISSPSSIASLTNLFAFMIATSALIPLLLGNVSDQTFLWAMLFLALFVILKVVRDLLYGRWSKPSVTHWTTLLITIMDLVVATCSITAIYLLPLTIASFTSLSGEDWVMVVVVGFFDFALVLFFLSHPAVGLLGVAD